MLLTTELIVNKEGNLQTGTAYWKTDCKHTGKDRLRSQDIKCVCRINCLQTNMILKKNTPQN